MSLGSSASRAKISLLTATAIVVANMVGTGVFTSLGFQVGDLPSGFTILMLWLVGGICALCGALCYGELAAALPRSGGEYHLLSQVYHPAAGFLAGWLSATVGFAAPIALAAMAFGKYFAHVAPLSSPLLMSIGLVVLVTLIHLRGVGVGAVFQNVATAFKVALILGLIGAGLAMTSPQPVSFLPHAGASGLITSAPFAVSLVYVMYAYSGWNASAYIVGEIERPGRNVPLSLAIGTSLVALLYLALNAVLFRSAPLAELSGAGEEVSHIAAAHIFGAAGGKIIAGLISFGLISSISAMTWIGPRVTMAMGEDYRAFAFLGRKNQAGVPARALWLQLGIVVFLLSLGSFATVLTYIQFALTVCSFFTVLGVMVLRFRQPALPRPYRTWGYPVTPLIFLAISLWMMIHIFRSNPRESLAGLGTLGLGLLVYFASPKRADLPLTSSATP